MHYSDYFHNFPVLFAFMWVVKDPTDDKSILVQVMAWCR